MYQVIIVIHILLGLGIIGLIMMQQGKGADAGAGFGAGASGSVFGAQGSASFLSRMTAIFATLFFITSLGLAWLNSNKGASVDIIGAFSKETASDVVLPGNESENLSVPIPQPENRFPNEPVASSPQPESSGQLKPSLVPNAPVEDKLNAPKVEVVPVLEEKVTEQKLEAEQKKPKAKQK